MFQFILFRYIGQLFNTASATEVTPSAMKARALEKVAYRQAALAAAPRSASAYEALGDAMREADHYIEALSAYEIAQQLTEQGSDQGGGLVGGSGLDTKIRLTRLDLDELQNQDPSYIRRLAKRESPCRQCGKLNLPDAKNCSECGANLPVDTLLDAWVREDIRKPVLRELAQSIAIITVLTIILCFVSWMPIEIKGVLLISTIIVLTWKGIRSIGDK